MADPICFACKHFRQYSPLTFLKPGECGWQPKEPWPAWLTSHMSCDDYYGPKREIWSRGHIVTECPAFGQLPEKPA